MSKTKSGCACTSTQPCQEQYNKYGDWVDGVWLPYEDMKECNVRC